MLRGCRFKFSSYLLFVLALTFVVPVHADDTHYQDFLVGGRALGLGGAYVSLADDPSGVYFNPAGLADVRQSSLQVSTSLYGFERGEINPDSFSTAIPGIANLELDFSQLIVIPASAGFVKTFGDKMPNGLPKQAFGLVAMIPSFRKMAISSPAISEGASLNGNYSRRIEDNSLWTGIAYGRKLSSKLRIGISAFYVFRTLTNYELVVQSSNDGESQTAGMAVREVSLYSGNFMLGLGAKYHVSPEFKLGISLQMPTIEMNSSGKLLYVRDRLSAGCSGSDCPEDTPMVSQGLQSREESFSSENKRSLMIRAGANYSVRHRFTVSADLSIHLPVCYDLIRVGEGTSNCESEEIKEADTLFPFVKTVRRKAVVNANLGVEWLLIPEVSIAWGFFTDFSSASEIRDDDEWSKVRQSPDVDLFGMSFALGYFGEHSLSRVGLMYSFGSGHDVVEKDQVSAVVASQLDSNAYQFKKVNYFQSFMYFFISSTFRY